MTYELFIGFKVYSHQTWYSLKVLKGSNFFWLVHYCMKEVLLFGTTFMTIWTMLGLDISTSKVDNWVRILLNFDNLKTHI
jgi:hypothetical protein